MNRIISLVGSVFLLSAAFSANATQNQWLESVSNYQWFAGSEDCDQVKQPAIETLKVNEQTYIFRQSKCQHFEAPFIYLLLGKNKAFLQDTGAIKSGKKFPLYQTVQTIIEAYKTKNQLTDYQLVVSHSHSHSDHYAGDIQFENKANITLIEPNAAAVKDFFKFNEQVHTSYMQLGARKLTVIHIPGHQAESVAVYDPLTGWLLTGDTIYPGRLYIRDWFAFKESINRLLEFSQQQPVTALMGTHIEMSKVSGQDYKMGATYQPNELPLPLAVSLLSELHKEFDKLGDMKHRMVMDKVIIYPLDEPNLVQKLMAWFAK